MFQLQIADGDVTNGTIAVTWCMDHELLKELAEKKITDPHVVICVAPVDNYHTTKEYRKVVPLKDLMTYIEFRAPGKNKIWGFISMKSGKDARSEYLGRSGGEFSTNVLNYDGDEYAQWLLNSEPRTYDPVQDEYEYEYKVRSHSISVVVPKAVFAKEPPKWEKGWVNHYFRDKVIDQCEYRRRRIFAYSLQPFLMLGNALLRFLIVTFSVLLLCKAASYKYVFHPLMYSLKDTFDVFESGSYAIKHLPEDDEEMKKFPTPAYLFKSFWKFPIAPFFWLPAALSVWVFHSKVFPVLWIGLLLGVFTIMVVIGFLTHHVGLLAKPFTWTWQKLSAVDSDDLWYMEKGEIELITCGEKKPLTYASLPAGRKTAKLQFQNMKSKVCKPFSL